MSQIEVDGGFHIREQLCNPRGLDVHFAKLLLASSALLGLWTLRWWRSKLLPHRPLHVSFVCVPLFCFWWLDASQHQLFATLQGTGGLTLTAEAKEASAAVLVKTMPYSGQQHCVHRPTGGFFVDESGKMRTAARTCISVSHAKNTSQHQASTCQAALDPL